MSKVVKFFKDSFADMKESAKAQHEVDKANFEAVKAESRASFEEAKMPPKAQIAKMNEERKAQVEEANARRAEADARYEAAKAARGK